MMKVFRSVKMIVALILTLTITALLPLNTVAAASGIHFFENEYLSEVYVAYGKDEAEAKKTLEDNGYTPMGGNLNNGGKTFVMMGYKGTNDIRESITDLAVMNMHGDYSVEDYKNLLKGQKAEIAEFLTEFMSAIREYRANLKAGKPKAVYVHDVLNNYIEDDTKMKMGDLLNSTTLQDKVGVNESVEAQNPDNLPNLVTILMQGNAQVIKSVETLLSMAADTADNSWLDRFAASDYDSLLDKVEEERPELNTDTKRQQYIDNLYADDASVLGRDVLALRGTLNDYASSGLSIETATEEDITKTFGDTENDANAMSRYQKWVSTGAVYEGLKNYEGGNYKKGELLEFFLEENDPEDTEIFIPMAAALSDGQRSGLPFVNLEQLLTFAFTSAKGWKNYVDENKANFGKPEDVSVYQNIDRGLYKEDGSVALTGAAQRANNTADGTTGDKEAKMDTISKITAISWAATAGCVAATITTFVLKNNFTKNVIAYSKGLGFAEEQTLKLIYDNKEYTDYFKNIWIEDWQYDRYLMTNKARLAIKLSKIFTVVTMAVAVFSAVMTIIDLCRDKSIEQLPIPNYLVDNYTDGDGGSYALNYKAVECNREEYFGKDYKKQKGNCADLNADEGKQWLVLYASKNSKAGKPLSLDISVQESSEAPISFTRSVHLFGEKGAVNLVSGAFKNYSTFSSTWQNLTDEYTMYIFIKESFDSKTYDESAGNMTASSFNNGMIAIIGLGGLVIGGALGAVITVLIKKNKKKKETAE